MCSTFFSPQDGGIHSGEVENERSLAFSPRISPLREQTVTYIYFNLRETTPLKLNEMINADEYKNGYLMINADEYTK